MMKQRKVAAMETISRKEAKEQGLKRYFTGKPCKHGHIGERSANDGKCCECVRIKSASYYAGNIHRIKKKSAEYRSKNKSKKAETDRIYREKNKDKIKEKKAEYREKNRESLIAKQRDRYYSNHEEAKKKSMEAYFSNHKANLSKRKEMRETIEYKDKMKEYREANKESIAKKNKEWRENNKEMVKLNKRKYNLDNADKIKKHRACYNEKTKEARSEYKREYRRLNPMYDFIRVSLLRIEKVKVYSEKYESMLGYSISEFRENLESQFKEGMSWENRSEWHIDHIKPIKAFLDEGITDPATINALDNLQPLWAHENLSKGAKYDE